MVVLRPMLDHERTRECRECHCIGLCSPVLERTTFRSNNAQRTLFKFRCRQCASRAQRERRRNWSAARHEAQRAQEARHRERHLEEIRSRQREEARKQRQEHPEHVREIAKRYRAKLAADPERVATRRENARIDYALRCERKGKPLAQPEPRGRGNTAKSLAVGPFRYWLNRLVAETARTIVSGDVSVLGAEACVAARVGLIQRRAWEYRRGAALRVDELTVDRACTNEGVRIEDIYCDAGHGMYGPERRP